jgi:hypothetical protein
MCFLHFIKNYLISVPRLPIDKNKEMNRVQSSGVSRKLFAGALLFSLIMGWNTGPAAAEELIPDTQWEKNYGAGITLTEVQETQDNSYTVMGTTYEGMIYLARSDAQGNQQWSKSIELRSNSDTGIEKPVNISSIRHTYDGGYLIGGTVDGFNFRYRDYVLVKTDKNGQVQWKEGFDSGAYGHFNMVMETKDGGSVDVLFTESLNAGSFHTTVQKRNAGGQIEWTTNIGGGGPASPLVEANSVEQTADGGYIVGGVKDQNFSVWKVNSSGSVEWNKLYETASGYVTQTPDGGYAIAGTNSSDEAVLIKTDAAGGENWSKALTGGQMKSLTNTPDGGYLIAQAQRVIKTDAAANVQWSKPVTNLTKAIPVQDGGILLLSSPDTLTKIGTEAGHIPSPQIGLKLDSEDYSLTAGETLDTVLTSVYGEHSILVTGYGSYSIVDPAIASVDASGNITGLEYGQTVLTATYNGMQTKANVNVYGAKPMPSGLKLDSEDYSLSAGQSLDTVLTVLKNGKTILVSGQGSYSISDPSIASVNAEGLITGSKRGVTVLKATYNGMETTATLYVY